MIIPTQSRITPKSYIKEALIHGKGLFAKEFIHAWEKVVVWWWANSYTNAEWAKQKEAEGKLIMQRDTDLFSYEDRGDDDTYFINHSCNGSLRMTDAFTLTARREIQEGEEITADYSLWESSEEYTSTWGCNCGAPNCRSTITGKDYLLEKVQKKYLWDFSPLINKRLQD